MILALCRSFVYHNPVKKQVCLLVALISIGCNVVLFSESVQSPDDRLVRAADQFFIEYEQKGNNKGLDTAIELLEKLHKAQPSDAALMVLLGRLYIDKGLSCFFLWNKFTWVKKGIALQDSAVVIAPDSLFIRYERAKSSYKLPKFLKRLAIAKNDFDILINMLDENKSENYSYWQIWRGFHHRYLPNGDLTTSDVQIYCHQMVYFYAGRAYYKAGNKVLARKYISRVIQLGANSQFGVYALLWLQITP